ncbi:hypothetical protein BECAL_01166 [Bellilinea caldifistulae]|uniref:Uncharacterized protein n=1 Tax=Bellilinea caldifistulae TaxID=360411 RepID=A0A0N8GND3_9CHLR|nr:hypothetical protein [Bellilinea caldifistulae]KPL77778.1 hypothetical protein AC812_02735 [Bellilinea caldifistulae]GAP10012.1 hypothetical protein BECAL_01166 [Bellilinea caldifistulae]
MTGKTNPALPAPFENTYFRERAIKAANRQKQGHILVSGSKPDNGQGLPLPYIHDVPGLRRGSYPYDYECEWGRFKYEYELSAYLFTPHNSQVPPGWEHYDLLTPIQSVTAMIDRARRLATIKTPDHEIVLRDVPVGDSPYNLLQQVNAALAQSCQPFVAWRLEWVSGEVDQLWLEGVPQVRNEHCSAYVTGYAHDEAGNLVYLGMVGHKTVLESIRATVQARQRKRLFLQGRPVYPLPTHYCQTWQHLPDYGVYHATLIADPALPGKWQPGEEVIYLLVFEGELPDGSLPETQARRVLASRLSETLPIPILDEWHESLWEARQRENLIVGLETGGDCQEGYLVQLTETIWKEVITRLLMERKIRISSGQ